MSLLSITLKHQFPTAFRLRSMEFSQHGFASNKDEVAIDQMKIWEPNISILQRERDLNQHVLLTSVQSV